MNETVKLVLRLPAPLHAILRDAAKSNGHSLNTEMVGRLSEGTDYRTLASRITELEKRLAS